MSVTDEQAFDFIQEWASNGADVARENKLPVSAMLACACVESGFGTGNIFRHTLNPFSLQKWPHVRYPTTNATFWNSTKVQETPPKYKRAPFNCATDVPDAVRQWCEWILHWGEADGPPGNQDAKLKQVAVPGAIANRQKLLELRDSPAAFAFNLPLVGFGENLTQVLRDKSGTRYRDALIKFSLISFD